jgi:hypothetical protein
MTITGTGSCAASGTISGMLSTYALTGTLTETSPETLSITGNVAANYNSASGTYQATSATGACSAFSGDSGTWTGTRMSSGVYGGMMMSAARLPVQVTLDLKSDASPQISGTVTFTNSACLRSVSVAGTLSGMNLDLQGDGGKDGSLVLTGTVNNEGKTLTLNSAVSGACQAESGAGTLTKMQ